jgi:5-methyltetrahydrofolate--homocysteine methyltransferase
MVYPNAACPMNLASMTSCLLKPAALAVEWAAAGQVNILGGCCSSSAHIAATSMASPACHPCLTSRHGSPGLNR